MSLRAEAEVRPIDVARAREETPGCANVIHFNNAGASLMPRTVLDTVVGHLRLEASIGGYEAAERAEGALDRVYDSVAALLSARREEIAVMENATRNALRRRCIDTGLEADPDGLRRSLSPDGRGGE